MVIAKSVIKEKNAKTYVCKYIDVYRCYTVYYFSMLDLMIRNSLIQYFMYCCVRVPRRAASDCRCSETLLTSACFFLSLILRSSFGSFDLPERMRERFLSEWYEVIHLLALQEVSELNQDGFLCLISVSEPRKPARGGKSCTMQLRVTKS